MSRSRPARLGGAALFCAVLGFVAACGFTGYGTKVSDGDMPGVDEGGASLPGEGGAIDGRAPAQDGDIIIGTTEGGTDASVDAEAGIDSSIMCPVTCTSCTGSTCNILCDATHPCLAAVVCPPGLACHVTCATTDVCSLHAISCANATACHVECTATHACETVALDCGSGKCRLECLAQTAACNQVTIDAKVSAGLCLHCDQQAGQPDCLATDATKPMGGKPCDLACGGGGCNTNLNGLNGCNNVAACPP